MPLTPEQKAELIAAYEPILYFHPDERCVPVKPEAYIQASALWCAQPAGPESLHKKENWGDGTAATGFPRQPLIPRLGISVNPADDTEGSIDTDGDSAREFYLGHQNPDGFMPYLVNNDARGTWLDLAGWQDSTDVSATSANTSCNVDAALERWRAEPSLQSAGDWYYAEVEELDTLTSVLATLPEEEGINPGQVLRAMLGDAWFIWYYFFYPIHQEDLRGCERVIGVGAHGNYEGDWQAVGVLVRKPLALPWEAGGKLPEPEWIGFGMRARGLVEDLVPMFRQQMDVYSWPGGEVRRVGRHPKVFVARGAHNTYALPGPKDPPAITLGDTACGITEAADEQLQDIKDTTDDIKEILKALLVTLAKTAVGCVVSFPVGCLIGGVAGLIEALVSGDDEEVAPVDAAVKDKLEQDHPPDPETYGLVLVPSDATFTLDDADQAAEIRPWQGRAEEHLADRDLHVWWPREGANPGYDGRWGVVCQDDPYDRRSGIVFPDFKRAFLLDLALHLSS